MASSSFRKIIATSLNTDFRKACQIVSSNSQKLNSNEVRVKIRYAGVNATDINFSAGRYSGPNPSLPMDVGLEGIGEIVDAGPDVPKEMIGRAVGYIGPGCYSEYMTIQSKHVLPLPEIKAEYVPLLVSGLTASISLEEFGRVKPGEKVLVTAAAGGFGHIAVQLAKEAGCFVIGTCSSQEKVNLLKSLGCDHVINYKEEDLGTVLKQKYPRGIDIIYESVGGDVFSACINRLAAKGRMIVLGYINSYHSPAGIDRSHRDATLVTKLLLKSSTISGFYLFNHVELFGPHLKRLSKLMGEGKLKTLIDTEDSHGKPFLGVESCFDAIDHLYSRKNKGKVIITIGNGKASKL